MPILYMLVSKVTDFSAVLSSNLVFYLQAMFISLPRTFFKFAFNCSISNRSLTVYVLVKNVCRLVSFVKLGLPIFVHPSSVSLATVSPGRHLTSSIAQWMSAKFKKVKRKVQGVPQSQTAALPRPQEEEETDKSKQAQTEQTYESTKISSLFPKRGNRNNKRTEKHKSKMTHGKTYNISPRRIKPQTY